MIKRLLFVLLSVITYRSFSQGEMTLPMMQHVYQASYYNPAAMPDHKVSIGLPILSSLQTGYINTGFLFYNGFVKENGVQTFSLDAIVNSMQKNNTLYYGLQTDFFHLRIKWRNSFVFFDAGNTTNMYANYSKDLFKFLTFQFADPTTGKGNVFDLSNTEFKLMSYNHFGIGLSKHFRKFSLGGRVKLLQGLAAAHFVSDNLKVGFGEDMYEIYLQNSGTLYTSGFNDVDASVATQLKNLGFALDLGGTYKPIDKLTFALSAVNLGFINWNHKIDNSKYRMDEAKGPFRGADILGPVLQGDSLGNFAIQDSIANYFETNVDSSVKTQAFRTNLTPRVYLSATYDILPRLSVSASVKFELLREINYAFMLGAQYKITRFFSLTGSFVSQYSQPRVGVGVVFKPGPFQFYIATDNIFPTYYRVGTSRINGNEIEPLVPLPLNEKTMNIRFGMNLVFGKILGPRKQAFNY